MFIKSGGRRRRHLVTVACRFCSNMKPVSLIQSILSLVSHHDHHRTTCDISKGWVGRYQVSIVSLGPHHQTPVIPKDAGVHVRHVFEKLRYPTSSERQHRHRVKEITLFKFLFNYLRNASDFDQACGYVQIQLRLWPLASSLPPLWNVRSNACPGRRAALINNLGTSGVVPAVVFNRYLRAAYCRSGAKCS